MYNTDTSYHLDDERCARLQQIAKLEQEMAGFLVRTAYVVLLSIPGISIVTAAEFAGEMGPITNYANDHSHHGPRRDLPLSVPERQGRPLRRPSGTPRQPQAARRDHDDRG